MAYQNVVNDIQNKYGEHVANSLLQKAKQWNSMNQHISVEVALLNLLEHYERKIVE